MYVTNMTRNIRSIIEKYISHNIWLLTLSKYVMMHFNNYNLQVTDSLSNDSLSNQRANSSPFQIKMGYKIGFYRSCLVKLQYLIFCE